MAKKVFKYETGQEVPEGAIYLKTVVQTERSYEDLVSSNQTQTAWRKCWLVWHYFLVDVPPTGASL